jgi:hypothetical protein
MSRTLWVDVSIVSGAIDRCVTWVNHTRAIDARPAVSWRGRIPDSETTLRVETRGIGKSVYHLLLCVADEIVIDTDRVLVAGNDTVEIVV